jgi:hypothetical protein
MPSIEKRTLEGEVKELKIIGTDEEIEEILDYIANGADETDIPENADSEIHKIEDILKVQSIEAILKGGWIEKRWKRLNKDIRNGINKVVPMRPYCAEYRDKPITNPDSPLYPGRPLQEYRETMWSRTGADSVKARILLMNKDIIRVRNGECR